MWSDVVRWVCAIGSPSADHATLVEVTRDVLPNKPKGKALVLRNLAQRLRCGTLTTDAVGPWLTWRIHATGSDVDWQS